MSDQWEFLFEAARRLNRKAATAARGTSAPSNGAGKRPGDDFCRRSTWADILEPHGWTPVREYSGKIYWRRQGKDAGHSATTGHCHTESRGDLLYIFSCNALPLEMDKSYSKFEAYAVLNHGGDFAAAARDLGQKGYGEQTEKYSFKRAGESSEQTPEGSEQTDHSPNDSGEEITADDVATIDDLISAGSAVQWAWEGWIPNGVLTAIAAPGGTGKTRFCADLLRRIKNGLPWPDGQPMTLSSDAIVLWVVADNHHDEMVTLSQKFGIKDNIRINAPKTDPYAGVTLESLEDYADLEARIKAVKPVFVIIDTVGNSTDKNLSRQEDAKAFYWPLQIIARRYRTCVLCLTHLNATGQFLGRRVLEKVRLAIRLEQPDDNDDRRRVEVVKSNSKRPDAIGMTMGDCGNEYDKTPPAKCEGGSDGPAAKKNTKIAECADWLLKLLGKGERRVSNTRTEAEAAGFNAKCLYAAKDRAGVEEYEIQGRKWWRLATISTPTDT